MTPTTICLLVSCFGPFTCIEQWARCITPVNEAVFVAKSEKRVQELSLMRDGCAYRFNVCQEKR